MAFPSDCGDMFLYVIVGNWLTSCDRCRWTHSEWQYACVVVFLSTEMIPHTTIFFFLILKIWWLDMCPSLILKMKVQTRLLYVSHICYSFTRVRKTQTLIFCELVGCNSIAEENEKFYDWWYLRTQSTLKLKDKSNMTACIY